MDGKLIICIIICIAICLISWICNSWIRILAACLLCTAHCLWFPAYFQAFLSYCLVLLVVVVTRECACAMGQVHGALGPLWSFMASGPRPWRGPQGGWGRQGPQNQGHGNCKKPIPCHVSQTLNHVSCDVKHTIFTAFKHAVCRVMHHIG